MLDYILFK